MDVSVMFKIFQQDIAVLIKNNTDNGDDEKLKLTQTRISAVAFMALAALSEARIVFNLLRYSFEYLVFATAINAALYVIAHDVFVLSRNVQNMDTAKSQVGSLLGTLRNMYDNSNELLSGKKDLEDCYDHPLIKGAYLAPLWKELFKAIDKK